MCYNDFNGKIRFFKIGGSPGFFRLSEDPRRVFLRDVRFLNMGCSPGSVRQMGTGEGLDWKKCVGFSPGHLGVVMGSQADARI